MDNQATESTSPLDTNQAASLFATMIDPEPEKGREDSATEAADTSEEVEAEEPAVEESDPDDDGLVTVEIDGKKVQLSKEQIAENHKAGLRQADYTRKTMELAEQKKSSDAQASQARAERAEYSAKLQEQGALLNALMTEQTQINWQQLLDTDPVEYLKQQHLYQQRQVALQNVQIEQQKVNQLQQAEQAKFVQTFLAHQQDELLAKLPDWKDADKAKAEKSALRDYLNSNGFEQDEINQLSDHRSVIVARKAMLYDKMMKEAKAAAKKVQNVPQRVERSSNGQSQNLDKRGQAFQRLSKSGRMEDAASVFASLL